ncbi:TIGR00266 family protein [Oribacterium sp. WCC10]|uniref:TIGR00266 family protein n=1 Tax=Oribacterium sp. WCC10 TaxID=1855343 RepID=UPI0008E0BC94|nr:TIGR00266 family protein [Oribacterium sp. WCC10]SFG51279.1 TIGR00266 family protein [Oribacterium sp. WCC10]
MRYSIEGEPLPVVICELESGESMATESGAMAWMSNNMHMETSGGGIGKMFGRMVSGESMFLNYYTAQGGPGTIAFASSFPGSIRPYEITPGNEIVAQKKAFLASTTGVELSIAFQKKLGTGFFGGEGFIMQKLSGNGIAFLEFDGHVKEYTLQPGQQMIIDTGYLAAMDSTCAIDIQTVKGVKNVLFGGEGLFNTVITGPGRIWLQTMPVPQVAACIRPYIPTGK